MMRCLAGVLVSIGFGVAAVSPAGAAAEVWATCGPFKGVSHVAQGVGVNNVQVGGQMAGMTGETTLMYDPLLSGQPFDVVHDNDTGPRSVVAQGARIVTTEPVEGGLVLVALYPNGIVETFHFLESTLVYAHSKHTKGLVTTSTYAAECLWSR